MESFNIFEILKTLPHRYPFLLVDRVIEFEPWKKIKAIKNVTINEPYFIGHFPDVPVMPGVLIVEAMAQAGGILAIKSGNLSLDNKVVYFAGIEKCKFRNPVFPGDTLILEAEIINNKATIWKIGAKAIVNNKICAEGIFTAAIQDRKE